MAIIEVTRAEYNKDTRWRVTFNEYVQGIFTHEESANKFVNSHLCEQLIDHLVREEQKKEFEHKQISYCMSSMSWNGSD